MRRITLKKYALIFFLFFSRSYSRPSFLFFSNQKHLSEESFPQSDHLTAFSSFWVATSGEVQVLVDTTWCCIYGDNWKVTLADWIGSQRNCNNVSSQPSDKECELWVLNEGYLELLGLSLISHAALKIPDGKCRDMDKFCTGIHELNGHGACFQLNKLFSIQKLLHIFCFALLTNPTSPIVDKVLHDNIESGSSVRFEGNVGHQLVRKTKLKP